MDDEHDSTQLNHALAIADLPHAACAGGIGYACRAAIAIIHHGIKTVAFLLEAVHQRAVE